MSQKLSLLINPESDNLDCNKNYKILNRVQGSRIINARYHWAVTLSAVAKLRLII